MELLFERINDLQPEHRAYALDSLAYHLFEAGQYHHLAVLFRTPVWRDARLCHQDYIYDGYIRDLDLAWEAAYAQGKAEIAQGQGLSCLTECYHYALIRTTINSLAASYNPLLVVRAVELGMWPIERALSLASRIPNNRRRAEMYASLLSSALISTQLPRIEQKKLQQFCIAVGLPTITDGDQIYCKISNRNSLQLYSSKPAIVR